MAQVQAVKTLPKKEFIAKWDRSEILNIDPLTFEERAFFEPQVHHGHERSLAMYHPVGIRFNELTPFFGRKTRITIEVIE